MFRKMRRFRQQVSDEECVRILKEVPRGVMAVYGEDGYPYAFPLDFIYDEESGKLYFHCAKEGHKLDAIRKNNHVSFCVMNEGFKKPGEWAWNITSVILFGRIREVTDPKGAEERIRKLGLKYYPTPESVDDEIRKAMKNVLVLEMTVDHMTGKLVHEE